MSNVPKAKNTLGPKIPGTDDYKQHEFKKAVAYGALAKEAGAFLSSCNYSIVGSFGGRMLQLQKKYRKVIKISSC